MSDRSAGRLLGTGGPKTLRGVQRAETIGALLGSIASFAIWGIAALMVLGELGVELGPLLAGAGIVGVAVGFGAQNLVRDSCRASSCSSRTSTAWATSSTQGRRAARSRA